MHAYSHSVQRRACVPDKEEESLSTLARDLTGDVAIDAYSIFHTGRRRPSLLTPNSVFYFLK